MKERPLPLRAWEIRAILDGRKTQIRRPVKFDHESPDHDYCVSNAPEFKEAMGAFGAALFGCDSDEAREDHSHECAVACPFGNIGTNLWIQETYSPAFAKTEDNNGCIYKSDYGHRRDLVKEYDCDWIQSTHMAHWASRLTLKVINIRVERVADISEEDAEAEGVFASMDYPFENGELPCPDCNGQGVHGAFGNNYGVIEVDCTTCDTMLGRFHILWNSAYKNKGFGWETNCYVWCISFKKL